MSVARCGLYKPTIPVLGRPRQEHHEVEDSLGCTARSCLKDKNKTTTIVTKMAISYAEGLNINGKNRQRNGQTDKI